MNANSPVVSTASSNSSWVQQPPPQPPQPPPPKILSCTNCRRRKIRCNKTTNPCLPCQASGTECIFPTRVRNPRPKQNNPKSRDAELLKRISHLESLVSRIDASKFNGGEDSPILEDDVRSNEPSSSSIATRPQRSFTISNNDQLNFKDVGLTPGRMDHQFASFIKRQETDSIYTHDGFWTRLSEEIDGLKSLIENSSDDEEEPFASSGASPASKYDSPSQFVFGSRVTSSNMLTPYPSDEHRNVLCEFYFKNVHPMMAIMHKPTTYLMVQSNSELFDPNTGRYKFKSLEASTFSLYLAAVTSMTNEECLKHLDEERDILVARYKTATEIALQESDFLNSVEIVTLQAFIVYIAVMRSHDRSRTIWTYIGLAVRIARGIGLHRDGHGDPFDREMRRRVWWTLLVLDTRASEDRGTETMITDGSFDTKMPSNINDEDLEMTSKSPPVDRIGLTSMTFPCITMTVSGIGLKMNFVPTQKDAPVLTLEQKEQMIKEFTDRIESTYLAGADPDDPKCWWLCRISRLLSLKLWLVTQYPLQRRKSTHRVLPRGQSLRTAMAYLNLTEEMWQHESSKGWFWFFQTYAPWHAIAVALAELCAEPTGPLADESWEVIEFHYNKWSDYVADTRDGMIWRPVKNLLKRAKAARGRERERDLSQSQASTSTIIPTIPDPNNMYSPTSGLNHEFSSMMSQDMSQDINNYPQPQPQPQPPSTVTVGQVINPINPIGIAQNQSQNQNQNQNPYNNAMGFDLSMSMSMSMSMDVPPIDTDTNMESPSSTPIPDAYSYSNTHWNEFIFGLGTVGTETETETDDVDADAGGGGGQNSEMEIWGSSFQNYFNLTGGGLGGL